MADIEKCRLGYFHLIAIGAASAVVLYALCWIAAAAGLSAASHLYLALFTTAPLASIAALAQGVCLSMIFGGVTGALIALFENLFAFLAPR